MQTDSGLDELRGTPLIVFSPAELNYDDLLLSETGEDALEQSTELMPGAGLHEACQCIARSTHHVRAEPVAIGRFQFYHRTAAGCLQPHTVQGSDGLIIIIMFVYWRLSNATNTEQWDNIIA